MDDIHFKTCVVCNTEKYVNDVYNYYRECKQCIIKIVSKRNYIIKGDIIKKRRGKYAPFKDLDNGLKALEEN